MGAFVAVAPRPRDMLQGYSGSVRAAFGRRLPLWAIVTLDVMALVLAFGAFKVVTGMVLDARQFAESEIAVIKDRDLWPFLTVVPAPPSAGVAVAALPVPDGAVLFAPQHPEVQRLGLFIDAPSPDAFEVPFVPPPIYTGGVAGGVGSGSGGSDSPGPPAGESGDPVRPDDPAVPPDPDGPAEPEPPVAESPGPVTRVVTTVVDTTTETVGAVVDALPLVASSASSSETTSGAVTSAPATSSAASGATTVVANTVNSTQSTVTATTDTVTGAVESVGGIATGTVGGLLER